MKMFQAGHFKTWILSGKEQNSQEMANIRNLDSIGLCIDPHFDVNHI